MKVKASAPKKSEESKHVGTQKCYKCGQQIPVKEWEQHMKLELLNPKWLEQKKEREFRQGLNSLATGNEISSNLKRFAAERRDISGLDEE